MLLYVSVTCDHYCNSLFEMIKSSNNLFKNIRINFFHRSNVKISKSYNNFKYM